MSIRFTLISAMYNVARYLPDFFESLDRQSFGAAELEVVLVDDGSTDDTLNIASEYASRNPSVRVVRRENGGQAAARNSGLQFASGDWVSFPDPDDVLEDDYLARVAAAIDADETRAVLYSARVVKWDELSGAVTDDHALAFRARTGSVTVDLGANPRYVQPHVHSAFFKRQNIADGHVAFDESLRFRFEDGNFASKYLLAADKPLIHFVPEARYRYRNRADGSSTVQASALDSRKYVDTIRYGYLGVISYARERGIARLPLWAQNLMLYDQFWILRSSFYGGARRADFTPQTMAELHALLHQFMAHIDESAIVRFDLMPVSVWMKDLLRLAQGPDRVRAVRRGGVDHSRGLFALEYAYVGDAPSQVLRVNGVEAEAYYTKDFALEYVGRPYAWKRTLWVPEGASIELSVGPHSYWYPGRRPHVASTPAPRSFRRLISSALRTLARLLRGIRKTVRWSLRRLERTGVRHVSSRVGPLGFAWLASRNPVLKRRFASAWVFMDRDVDANDSAEVLYKWIVAHHPEVNAWFVVRKSSSGWQRLASEGARLVPYGSGRHYALLRNAENVVSSHADKFVTSPSPRVVGRRRWNFVFLQHGVIKSDISRWLNTKRIDLLVASTEAEYSYIIGPSPYKFSAREVRLTGLPRFDDLLIRDSHVAREDKNVILFAPTWRDYLVGDMSSASNRRGVLAGFEDSTYARNVVGFLSSPDLERLAGRFGCKVVFLPHPNMRAYLRDLTFPEFVKVQSYDDENVRDLVARTRVLVTDYSSFAFNLAYVQRETVYFQFDTEEFRASHTERPGYFDYEVDGFGPVAGSVDEAVSALEGVLGGEFGDTYLLRIRETFPVRDGRNSARVYDAIKAISEKPSLATRSEAAALDSWAMLTKEE